MCVCFPNQIEVIQHYLKQQRNLEQWQLVPYSHIAYTTVCI